MAQSQQDGDCGCEEPEDCEARTNCALRSRVPDLTPAIQEAIHEATRAEIQEILGRVRMCGPKPPTVGDSAIVVQFARFLRGEITEAEFNAFNPE